MKKKHAPQGAVDPVFGPQGREVTVGEDDVAGVTGPVAGDEPVASGMGVVDDGVRVPGPQPVDGVERLGRRAGRRRRVGGEVVRRPDGRHAPGAEVPDDPPVFPQVVEGDPLGPVQVEQVHGVPVGVGASERPPRQGQVDDGVTHRVDE